MAESDAERAARERDERIIREQEAQRRALQRENENKRLDEKNRKKGK